MRRWSRLVMNRTQKRTDSSPVVVIVKKYISTLNSPSPKVVTSPADMCERQYTRLNIPKHLAFIFLPSSPFI